ncbi:MAG: putative chitinase [Acidobacteriota bacterium]
MKSFKLTLAQLRNAMPGLSDAKARAWLDLIQASLDESFINTRIRVCAYLPHLGHESMDLTHWRENMNYSAKQIRKVFKKRVPTDALANQLAHNPVALANHVYGNRSDLGNFMPGDGWKFIARGPIGITGRDMYRKVGLALNLPLEEHPELLELPENGFRAAAWFWTYEKQLNPVADKLRGVSDSREFEVLKALTKGVNGGLNGLDDRVTRYENTLRAIPSRGSVEVVKPVNKSVDEPVDNRTKTSIPAQDSVQDASSPISAGVTTSTSVDAQPAQTPATTDPGAGSDIDFKKLLRKESVKQSAKVASVRGAAALWRPILLLITALKGGSALAISGTILGVLVLVVAVVLYHKQILDWIKWAARHAVDFLTD